MDDRLSKQDLRKGRFKKSIDRDEARRQREDNLVCIRKAKREENIMKKRRERLGVPSFRSNTDSAPTTTDSNAAAASIQYAQRLPIMLAELFSNDPHEHVRATLEYRRLLSIEKNPPIAEVIAQNVVPRFVHFLTISDNPQLQFEAAWVLTNIASGTSVHTKAVIESGAIPIFVSLLDSPYDDVREQAVWALGNIAGDSATCRDLVLFDEALHPLLLQLTGDSKLTMFRNATWTLSNLCRGKPPPKFYKVKPALATLAHVLYNDDDEVLTDACWALSYLSDGDNDRINAVVESGVVKRLVELLMHQSMSVQTPALRAVGNIVTGDDVQTQFVINSSALPCLLNLLHSPKSNIKKEACWTISNITAGNKDQIQAVIDANIAPPLIHMLMHADFEIKKEAAWSLSNATSGGTSQQIKYLVSQGLIEPFCNLLTVHDVRIVSVALEGLENILRVGMRAKETLGATFNDYAQDIEALDGLDKIEALQQHDDQEVYEKSVHVLEVYFMAGDDGEIGDIAPPNPQGYYGFGAPKPPPEPEIDLGKAWGFDTSEWK